MENQPDKSGSVSQAKRLFIKDLKPSDYVQTSLMIRSKSLQIARDGKPYLNLLLGDRTGEIETRVWQDAERLAPVLEEGQVISIAGRVHEYHRRLQLTAEHVIEVPIENYDAADYLIEGPGNLDEIYERLLNIFRAFSNPWVRQLALALLEDPEISERYKICPAAKTVHHAFLGGLLVHSMQLIDLVEKISPLYPTLDREILIFGAAFHDFGKIFELSYPTHPGYTDEGKLVGHITIGVTLIDRKVQQMPGFPKSLEWHLKHLILSHHGKMEYGSPKVPATLEAEMVHMLDLLDSRMDGIESHIRADRGSSRWTSLHKAYGVSYFKPDRYVQIPKAERDTR